MLALYLALIDDKSDEEFFSQVYENYQKQMWYVARDVLKDDGLAEDATQNAFCSIAKNIKTLRAVCDDKVRFYLLTCAKNSAVDMLRKEIKHRVLNIDDFSGICDEKADKEIDSIFSKRTVMDMLECLKQKYRDVLYMHFVMGLSEKEISEMLDIKINTVRQQIYRGRKMLKDIYDKENGSDE